MKMKLCSAMMALVAVAQKDGTKRLRKLSEAPLPVCDPEAAVYSPFMANVTSTSQSTAQTCQTSCAVTAGCAFFSYNTTTHVCGYSGSTSVAYASDSAVSGPAQCLMTGWEPPAVALQAQALDAAKVLTTSDAVECSVASPTGFPAGTAAASNALWPSGAQPERLACWPRLRDSNGAILEDADGNPTPAMCHTEVLESTTNGWPGVCDGLYAPSDYKQHVFLAGKTCEEQCYKSASCPSYQVTPAGTCFVGMGVDCYVRDDYTPTAAKRYMRGSVHVLMNLAGWQVYGLSKLFGIYGDGMWDTHTEAAQACKIQCYSDLYCQWWSYSNYWGCFAEDVERAVVQWPMTSDGMNQDSAYAKTAIAGEYIQHVCEPANATVVLNMPGCATVDLEVMGNTAADAVVTSSPGDCQAKCAATDGCQSFTFYSTSSKCALLTGNSDTEAGYFVGAISGPAGCSTADAIATAAGVTVTAEPSSTSLTAAGVTVTGAAVTNSFAQFEDLHLSGVYENLVFSLLTTDQISAISEDCAEVLAQQLEIATSAVYDAAGNLGKCTWSDAAQTEPELSRRLDSSGNLPTSTGSRFTAFVQSSSGATYTEAETAIVAPAFSQALTLQVRSALGTSQAIPYTDGSNTNTPLTITLTTVEYHEPAKASQDSSAPSSFGGMWVVISVVLCCLLVGACGAAAFLRNQDAPKTSKRALSANVVTPATTQEETPMISQPDQTMSTETSKMSLLYDAPSAFSSSVPFPDVDIPPAVSSVPFPDAGTRRAVPSDPSYTPLVGGSAYYRAN